jgi:serine/threonine protein kinase
MPESPELASEGFRAPIGQEPPPPAAGSSELGQIGEFRLIREIGRGGMGIVYEAHQSSLNRRVALKILPLAAALEPKQLKRFQHEAQAAAQLHHTNIVPVYAVGCERGVHYYAMQYIDGQALAAVIAELRQQTGLERGNASRPLSEVAKEMVSGRWAPAKPAGGVGPPTMPYVPGQASHASAGETAPRGRLSTEPSIRSAAYFRTVANLGIQAAEALEHAHRLGIVHRDIKPANLLVDPQGDLWITDFGLALFQSGAGLTMTGELVGTLRYMSPEQALAKRSEVDHRTDIYSLGVTLYEQLTLQQAFDGEDREELFRQITLQEPRELRRVNPAIPVELETIVLKAIRKSPAERYTAAQDLADDLQRFLDDKPILARRPTFREKAVKWARRHRAVVASALALMVLTMIGSIITTVIIAQEHAWTIEAYRREQEQRASAEQNFHRAREAVDQLVQISEKALAGKQDLEGLRWRLLDAALSYYQGFLDQRRDDPSIQAELARMLTIRDRLTTLVGSWQYWPLHDERVQDDIGLSEKQRAEIARMHRNWWQRTQEAKARSAGEQERQRLDLARDQENKVPQLLTPAQFQRFKQIARQYIGPLAFSDPEVVEAIHLSADQRSQIRAILDEADYAATEFGPHGDSRIGTEQSSEAKRRALEGMLEAKRCALERILGVLSAEQRRNWDGLRGKPFRFAGR